MLALVLKGTRSDAGANHINKVIIERGLGSDKNLNTFNQVRIDRKGLKFQPNLHIAI